MMTFQRPEQLRSPELPDRRVGENENLPAREQAFQGLPRAFQQPFFDPDRVGSSGKVDRDRSSLFVSILRHAFIIARQERRRSRELSGSMSKWILPRRAMAFR